VVCMVIDVVDSYMLTWFPGAPRHGVFFNRHDSSWLYHLALDASFGCSFACGYALALSILNGINWTHQLLGKTV